MGLIGRPERLAEVVRQLPRIFGTVDFLSDRLRFDFTAYYAAEMGEGLERQFVAFRRPIRPEQLVDIKLRTNRLEQRSFSARGKRQVNIDPGYLTLSKLVLATTKDHQHRVYLGRGIYAEVTLRFRAGTFAPWDWTYPDYRTPAYIAIFNQLRARLLTERSAAACRP
jgi:hypothetical protein